MRLIAQVDMLLQAEAFQASLNPKGSSSNLLNVSGMSLPACQQASSLASLLPVWHQQQQQQNSGSTSPSPSVQQRSNGEIAGMSSHNSFYPIAVKGLKEIVNSIETWIRIIIIITLC